MIDQQSCHSEAIVSGLIRWFLAGKGPVLPQSCQLHNVMAEISRP